MCAAAATKERATKDWRISIGSGLIVAPAFTGARDYTLQLVPDLRVTYKELFFANVRDGIGYALLDAGGWRVGPVVTYTFAREEGGGGSIFRIAGRSSDALQGMGDVDGTTSVGGFAEYSLPPYRVRLHLQQGVNGHHGLVGEARVSYGGTITYNGPPLIYSFGPHIKFGDQRYLNAYWGITPEQSMRSGLEPYSADAGLVAYGLNGFARLPLTGSLSASLLIGFDRLAPPVADSPLIRVRGAENQVMGGLFISYGF
ncbi:MAG: MipA/OmpV family protein [Desulfuromonadales bacterium]|nr:MipA/OmpV family protein [Desulfuromonadales bacterium]